MFIIPLGEGGLAKIKGDESFRIVIGGIMKVFLYHVGPNAMMASYFKWNLNQHYLVCQLY